MKQDRLRNIAAVAIEKDIFPTKNSNLDKIGMHLQQQSAREAWLIDDTADESTADHEDLFCRKNTMIQKKCFFLHKYKTIYKTIYTQLSLSQQSSGRKSAANFLR